MTLNRRLVAIAISLSLALPGLSRADEKQSLDELRNTVVNLLQAMVDQGLLSREKAAQLVKQAQDKASADAAIAAKRDEGAVRVPYVPQTVKDDIAKQVAEEVKPAVVEGVVQQAKTEGWGVPGALPEWVGHVRVGGDVRVRGQADIYGRDNTTGVIPDYQAINAAGGLNKAFAANTALLNVSEDRERLRVRARLGAEVDIDPRWQAGVRLATGTATDPSSESQTLGTTGERYPVGFDLAYIRFQDRDSTKFPYVTAVGGRYANPWFTATELIWARDLTFDGVAATGRYAFGGGQGDDRSHLFLTADASPIQDVPLASGHSKWLVGLQGGVVYRPTDADRVTGALGYFNFIRVQGVANNPSYFTTLNYTAPQFVRYGNTMYAITTVSATDPSAALFGLASKFKVEELSGSYDHHFDRYDLVVNGDIVRNAGFSASEVQALTGQAVTKRNRGYVFDVAYGDLVMERLGDWRAALGYRYVERDAVLDAWTDADFHEGGTNAKGYYLLGDYGVAPRTFFRLRYLSANEIDGPRYGVDIVQLDLNTRF